jgi:glycosyltransferase involved in cell wall biosynthesis
MKIAYMCMDPNVSLSTPHRAPTIHIAATIEGLERLGHHVVPFLYGDQLSVSEAALRRTAGRPTSTNSTLRFARRLASDGLLAYQDLARDRRVVEPILSAGGFEGVYERLYHPKGAVTRAAGRLDLPVVVEVNAPAEERKTDWGSPLHAWIRRRELASLARADAVIVMSTTLKDHYVHMGVAESKVTVLPNGFDERRFSPDLVENDIRSRFSLEAATVVGFVGNIHRYHGTELLIPMARRLERSRPEVRFLIVGAGPHLAALTEALDSAGLGHLFSLAGSVPHSSVPDYIEAMDLCVLPNSTWYGSPMKLLEYAAMGKAVVAPDLGAVRDIFTHGETAYLFRPGDIDALGAAVDALAADPALRTRLGRTARDHVLGHHTWRHNALEIQRIFEQLS